MQYNAKFPRSELTVKDAEVMVNHTAQAKAVQNKHQMESIQWGWG